MASIALSSFASTAQTVIPVSGKSQTVVLPTTGSPTLAIVTNPSSTDTVFVLLGGAGLVVTTATGMPILPRSVMVFTITPNTTIAAINSGNSVGSNLYVTVGN